MGIFKFIISLNLTILIASCTGESGRRDGITKASTGPQPGVPTVLKIETAPNGNGTEIGDLSLGNGEPLSLFAVSRDAFGDFVSNVSVNWSSSTVDGYFSQITGDSTIFTPTGDQEDLLITASHISLNSDITGIVSVIYDVENFTGLTLWLRANTFLGKLANNDNVITWNDLNGSGRSLVALGSGQEPTYITNSINGHPSIRFTAANSDGLKSSFPISDVITNTEFTYFIIFNTDSITTDDSDPSRNNALMIDNSGYFGSTLRSSTPIVQSYNFDGSQTVITKAISLSTTYLFTSYHEAGNLYAQINGDAASTIISGDTDNLGGQLTLGGGFAPAGFFNGDIAEVIIYNNGLPLADRLVVQNYLCAKYALTCP